MEEGDRWRRCSGCKKDIAFGADHYVCNVSTCNRRNTAFVFCSVSCWDGHLGIVRHRESWAVEARAPTRAEYERQQAAPQERPKRATTPSPPAEARRPAERSTVIVRKGGGSASSAPAAAPDDALPQDTLIVASKLKQYVKAKAGLNCSDRVLAPLSDAVRRLCDDAIRKATADERKTLLERDFE